jgi:hypothetical protein
MMPTTTETVMRTTRIALFTGIATIILAGIAGMAEAQTPEAHVMTLRLPDGRVEQIRYIGDVPPTVVVAPDAVATSFAPASPFALLQQMSADMQRQEAAMFQTINALTMPNGGGFGMIPVLSGPGVCARSVQITFTGNGQAPHVVSRTAGDCGPAQGHATPATLPSAPVPNRAPNVIEARSESPSPG